MTRPDDFNERRKKLAHLSEEELEARFWDLAEKIVDPILELARSHTSPSIERSVLLRMGFSSLEAKAIVEYTMDNGLMAKGAGNLVYRLANKKNISIREAGLQLAEGHSWDQVKNIFSGGGANGTKA